MPGVTPAEYVIVALTVCIGGCLQGSIGFGLGTLSAPVLALVDRSLIPVPLLMLALLATALLALREHTSLDPRGLGWAMTGRVPGTALGAAAVAWLPARGLDAAFSGLILLAVGISVIGRAPRRNRATLATAGTLSGVMGTTVNTGGPPMAVLYQRASGSDRRANLSGFFFVGSLLSVVLLGVFGQVGLPELLDAVLLVPPMLVGLAASGWTARHLDAGRTRIVRSLIFTVASLAAVVLLMRALFG